MQSSAHSEDMPLIAHSKAMTSISYYDQPRSLNNFFHQRRHFLKGSKSYRLVSLSWGLPSIAHSVWINTINNFRQQQHQKKRFCLYVLRNRQQSCEAIHIALTTINQDHSMNKINEYSYPIPTENIYHNYRGIKNIFIMSLILTQNKTNKKSKYSNTYKIISHMQQLTHTPTENPSTKLHGNQQNIYDINIQCQEL